MDCQPYREALSAFVDGEEPGMAWSAVQQHLAGCGACQRWSDEVMALEAALPLLAAEVPPDLPADFLARIAELVPTGSATASSGRDLRRWRWALVLVVVGQLGVALTTVVLGAIAGDHPHLAQELGSWDIALALGFLFAAWRPARAWGMLPLVAALVVCMTATSLVGLLAGQASVLAESTHVLEVVGLGLLWVLARSSRPPVPRLRLA